MTLTLRTTPLLLLGALALSGCSDDTAAPSGTDAPAPATVSAPTAGINAPIPAEDIDTRLELVGSPVHVAGGDTLRLTVRVHNDGRATLVSEGTAKVNLGVMLVGPEGPDTTPGNRDFQRMTLPEIPAGGSAEVTGELPVQPLLGLPLRIELVQEGVNWFSAYGEVSLDLGPFARCADDASALCGADGQPLATE